MNNKYPCDIILDLLPAYMEGIVSKETTEVFKEHLSHCDRCKEIYEQMNCDISLQIGKKKKLKKRIKAKRYMFVLGYLLFLALVVFVIMLEVTFH